MSHTHGSLFPLERSHTIRGCSANVFKKTHTHAHTRIVQRWTALLPQGLVFACSILVPAALPGEKSLYTLFWGQGGARWPTTNWQRKLLLDSARHVSTMLQSNWCTCKKYIDIKKTYIGRRYLLYSNQLTVDLSSSLTCLFISNVNFCHLLHGDLVATCMHAFFALCASIRHIRWGQKWSNSQSKEKTFDYFEFVANIKTLILKIHLWKRCKEYKDGYRF